MYDILLYEGSNLFSKCFKYPSTTIKDYQSLALFFFSFCYLLSTRGITTFIFVVHLEIIYLKLGSIIFITFHQVSTESVIKESHMKKKCIYQSVDNTPQHNIYIF